MARIGRVVRLPHAVLDTLAQTHASVDLETGHLICHYHEVGAALVEVGGRVHPMLLIGGCILATADPEAVDAVESESTPLEGVPGELHSDPSAAQWLSVMLQLVGDIGGKAAVYATPLGDSRALTIIIRDKGGSVAVLLLPECVREEEKRLEKRGAGVYL